MLVALLSILKEMTQLLSIAVSTHVVRQYARSRTVRES